LYLAYLKTSIIDEISNGHCRYSCIEHARFTIMSTTIFSTLFEARQELLTKETKKKPNPHTKIIPTIKAKNLLMYVGFKN
jgi:hypothetical protein